MATPASIVDFAVPTVALVGRVNVGKSTLFNRIVEKNLAMVSPLPGTTRTRNISLGSWRGKQFRLIDTGGLTFDENVELEEEIIHQTEIALAEADVVVFVTDVQTGLLPQEKELAKRLRQGKNKRPIMLVTNKVDGPSFANAVHDKQWRQLGLGAPMPISAVTGAYIGDFLDALYKQLNKAKRRPKKVELTPPIRVAIMGRPNVGKSSLFNKLIGEDRVIVSPLAHTTREPHDTLVTVGKEHILFVDTAGIRRKAKVEGSLERMGITKSIGTINRADVVLLVLDASDVIANQDQQLGGLLREHARSVIIVINKWDTADDNDDAFRNEVKEKIYKSLPHLDYAPIVFTSALTGYRTHQLFPLISQAYSARQIVLEDDTLKEFLKRMIKKHLPTRGKGVRHPRIVGMRQIATNPPTFDITVKAKTSLHMSYVNFLENQMRIEFGFFATPLVMKLSKLKRFTDPRDF
jgi:GTP-binding protein